MIKNEEEINILVADINEKFLSSLSNRCPATMFADSRIDRVIGRIMFLVSSINTMKFIKAFGVPVGTMWAIMFLVLFNQPKIIMAIQKIRAVDIVIIIWDVGVNTNGDKAILFIIITVINKEIKIIVDPFLLLLWRSGFNSLIIGFEIVLLILFHFWFKYFIFKIKKMVIRHGIQA
jgi:hypothetical protein